MSRKIDLASLYPPSEPCSCEICLGQGPQCHADLERDWNTPARRALVARWCELTRLWGRLEAYGLKGLKNR
jgi:hypothetical protein